MSAPVLRSSMPGRYYTAEEIFAAERTGVFGRSWVCVGRAADLPAAGDFVGTDVGGESIVVMRGRDDEFRGFHNVCRHRGTRLCAEGRGSVGNAISCMYHAWTYDLDGTLIAAPNMRDMPDGVRATRGLRPVACEQWLGYLWVNLNPAADPLAAQTVPQVVGRLGCTETLDRYRIGELTVARTIVYEVEANWKALVENFTECYHCATLHPELTAAVPQFGSGYGSISGDSYGAEIMTDGFAMSGRAGRPRLPGLLPADDRLFYGIILLPNVFLILVPDHVAVFRLDPRSSSRTTVTVDWLFDPAATRASDFDPADAVAILDITNRQDFAACERAQLGMRSAVYEGVLVPAEHLITEFHDYLRERVDYDQL